MDEQAWRPESVGLNIGLATERQRDVMMPNYNKLD
jgi:hypothetical protein